MSGFKDGSVFLGEIGESKKATLLKSSSGNEITAIATNVNLSHVLFGDSKGNVLWTTLWAE